MQVTCQRATDKNNFVHTLFYSISNDLLTSCTLEVTSKSLQFDVTKSLQLPIKVGATKDILQSQSDWPGRRVSSSPAIFLLIIWLLLGDRFAHKTSF